jgi:hypothetical protein
MKGIIDNFFILILVQIVDFTVNVVNNFSVILLGLLSKLPKFVNPILNLVVVILHIAHVVIDLPIIASVRVIPLIYAIRNARLHRGTSPWLTRGRWIETESTTITGKQDKY